MLELAIIANMHIREIKTLDSLLEAEINGQPFDKEMALKTANLLSENCPSISKSMKLIAERLMSN